MKRFLFYLGLFLLALNLTGLFIPLRNPAAQFEKNGKVRQGPPLTEGEVYQRISRNGESNAEYVLKVNSALHKGIVDYWDDDGIAKYNLRVPVYENYLLFLAQYVFPEKFKKYTYYDTKKAIARGVGQCNQQAMIMAQLLERQGIESRVVSLTGHVVAMARVDEESDTWWVVDPDYGVVVKRSISEIENDPELIRGAYTESGYDRATIDLLVKMYRPWGNQTWESARAYYGKKYYVEILSYAAIWLIPMILLLPYLDSVCCSTQLLRGRVARRQWRILYSNRL